MYNNRAKLIIFTGPSGVGKGTVLTEFFSKANDIVYSVSNTTRKPRAGEIDGKHYFFVTEQKFKEMIKNNCFLEWANYSGNYYGTNKTFVEENIKQGKSVLLEIELQGALSVMEKCPNALSIFITPPNFEELERRLRNRHTESEENIQKRLLMAKRELENIDKFDYIIENDEVEKTAEELLKIYNKETR